MEFIKKKIYRIMTTGTTVPCSYRDPNTGVLITGCTAMTMTLVPDLTVNYFIKFGLFQDAEDIGFFDAYLPFIEPTPPAPPTPGETFYLVDNNGDVFTDDNNDKFIF